MEILDCTIRDGGYLNNWKFDDEIVREIYRSISKSGVDFVELGFLSTKKFLNKNNYGPWRFLEESKLREITMGIEGPTISAMIDFKNLEIHSINEKENSLVDLIRIAAHKNEVKDALEKIDLIKSKGYIVAIQLMGYSTYTQKEQENVIELLEKSNIDYAYIADSYGSILPFQISKLFEPLLELSHLKVGFHPHNNLQMAFVNALEALKAGVHIVDGTIYGMGRGAGNLPIETLISYLQILGSDKYNVIPVLHLIDKYFVDLYNKYQWGHHLPYMLSGLFNCHPNYPKRLVELHEYTIEDIWKALDRIKKLEPIGYKEKILDKLIKYGLIGTEGFSIENLSKPKLIQIKRKPEYINRHKGRDFIILANGPSLKRFKVEIDLFIQKYNPIVLGANFLSNLFIPDYHAFNNKRRFQDYISTVNSKSKLLLSIHFPPKFIAKYTLEKYESLFFSNTLTNFGIKEGIILSNCKTISVLLLGVAIVMGAKRVFAAGLDGYLNTDSQDAIHFYNEKDDPEDFEIFIEKHQSMEYYIKQINNYLIEQKKEGIHILTPTGFKNFYKSIKNYI